MNTFSNVCWRTQVVQVSQSSKNVENSWKWAKSLKTCSQAGFGGFGGDFARFCKILLHFQPFSPFLSPLVIATDFKPTKNILAQLGAARETTGGWWEASGGRFRVDIHQIQHFVQAWIFPIPTISQHYCSGSGRGESTEKVRSTRNEPTFRKLRLN